jgi:hypothetical protein
MGSVEAEELADADFDELEDAFADNEDLDKMWSAVGWVLRRCGAPVDPVQAGSEHIGEDFGFGPLIYFPPEQAASIAASLDAVTDADLAGAIDFDELTRDDIYPNVWERAEEHEDLRDWIVSSCQSVILVYRIARQKSFGVIVHFS